MSLVARLANTVRWLRRSSTLRLTLMLSVVFAVGMAATVIIALFLGREALLDRVDVTLEDLAASVEADVAPEESGSVLIFPLSDLDDLPRAFARAARNDRDTVSLDDEFRGSEEWRVLTTEDNEGTPVLIAVSLDDSEDALELLGGVLSITALVVVGIALTIGLMAGLLAERRMRRITDALDRLAAGDLSARTGIERNSDDLDDLARHLDGTAVELERLVDQTRHLSASIAHDLRTPLARLSARLERLPEGEARRDALEEAARLSGIFDTIMRVARIEAAQGVDGFVRIDLEELVTDLAETFGPVIEDAGKHLRIDQGNAATVLGERQMLVQAVANLLQNALVHGGPEITLVASGKTLRVEDNGPGVDPDQYAEILKPMVRLDMARASEGTGLGLALVKAVADRHGAELTLSAGSPQGLRVSLTFART